MRSGEWVQLKGSNAEQQDSFGAAVSLSGNTIVVAAGGEDSQSAKVNGDETDNSYSESGAAYVFSVNCGQVSAGANVPGC